MKSTTKPLLPGETLAPSRFPTSVSRILLIGLGGASYDVLVPLAADGVMPNFLGLTQTAALVRLRSADPLEESVAWATLQAGGGPGVHGVLDDYYLDHRRGRIRPTAARARLCPALGDLITAASREEPAIEISDLPAGQPLWQQIPTNFETLCRGIALTETAIRGAVAAACRADRRGAWRLLQVRFSVLDSLLHRLWRLLGIGRQPGGKRRWIEKTREAFRTLDDSLGELLQIARRRDAAVVLVSPYGFCPFRQKITLPELLRAGELLHLAGGVARLGYRTRRLVGRARKLLVPWGCCQPSPLALLPLDWRRSRAVTLHGRSAALVYLNTPERFGTRVLLSRRQREQAATEAVAALHGARHPDTGEPLFSEAYLAEERFGCDPLERCWPEVIGIPAAGFHTRHRLDHKGHLLRSDRRLAAARNGEGLLVIQPPGVVPGGPLTAELIDVAPTMLGMLGLPPGAAMTGRAAAELFTAGRPAVRVS